VRTQRYCLWAREGNVRFGQQVETVMDSPAFALLDARHGFGQTMGAQAVRVGIDKAKAHGFSVIGLRRSGHLGRIGAWAEMACAEGLISIHFVNVAHSLLVAPFGGAERRMATDPVAIGVPCEGGDFLLDFATSTVAEGKCLVAKRGGKPLPHDALVGPDGRLTSDPDVLYGETPAGVVPDPRKGPGALTAMGAHKGSGLALACELLAGALTGSGTCGPGERIHNGMLSIYIDPARMDDGHGWAGQVRAYLDYVRACRPADPDLPVLVPGDPERMRRAERLARGLPLSGQAWESILSTGDELGLDRAELSALAEKETA
jgi:hydroxycarboxylate dehydrogenase B